MRHAIVAAKKVLPPRPFPVAAVGLEAKVRALCSPAAYPEKPTAVDSIETHFSWVFLGDQYAYKLKKPVRLVGLDLSSLDARAFDCAEEVRLNRRLAPSVYLGTVPLMLDASGTLSIDGSGEAVDWLVRMRRLPAAAMLDRAIAAHSVRPEQLHALGLLLVRFYSGLRSVLLAPDAYVSRLERRIAEDRRHLLDPALAMDAGAVHRLIDEQSRVLGLLRAELGDRARQGRIVEAHGDLRPEHVCLSEPPCIIDALEFSLDLRTLDAVEELAFLHMECEVSGAAWVGSTVVNVYRELSGDAFTPALFDFYRSRRACVRAKLVARHRLDSRYRNMAPWASLAAAYVDRAMAYAQAVD